MIDLDIAAGLLAFSTQDLRRAIAEALAAAREDSYLAGQEAMRERAAKACAETEVVRLGEGTHEVQDDGATTLRDAASAIRALPTEPADARAKERG